jgi:hypothetical protein
MGEGFALVRKYDVAPEAFKPEPNKVTNSRVL